MLGNPRLRHALAAIVLTSASSLQPLAARETPAGLPLIRSVVPVLEDASPQSFGLAVDPRGLLYVGNLTGLLVYNGATWQSLRIGAAGTVMALAVDDAGRVGVGGMGDFGLVVADALGALTYNSLSARLDPADRTFDQVLDVVATPGGGFAFLTGQSLWHWDGQNVTKVREFPEDGPLPALFSCRGAIYLWSVEVGIEQLDGVRRLPVPGGDHFRGERVRALLPGPDDSLLVVQREAGLSLLRAGHRTPFAPEASAWVGKARVLRAITLPTGGWALGSLLGGVLTLHPDGSVERRIDTTNGLSDDFVNDLAVDHEGALWVALNSDLVRIEASLPLSAFDRRTGLEGSPYGMIRHRGELYVATAAGLFTTGPTGEPGGLPFRSVPGFKPSVWSLLSRDEELLVGTSDGLWISRPEGAPRQVPGFDATVYTLAAPPGDPDAAWLGLDDGFAVVRRQAGTWVLERRLHSDSPVRAIVERGGRVWLATETRGVISLGLPLPPPGAEQPRQVEGPLSAGSIFAIGGTLVVPAKDRLLRIDTERNRLIPAPDLDRLAADGRHGFLKEDRAGNVWRATQPLSIVLAGWASAASPAVRTLPELPARSVEFFFLDDDGAVWFAAENGLYRWAGAVGDPAGPEVSSPLLESVTSGTSVLRAGRPGAPPATIDLAPSLRRLRLHFAPLSFRTGLRYQSRLDPLDNDWSPPSPEPFSELTRLAPGDYTFRVRTVRSEFEIGPETRWSFRVLPPWYRTPWAYLGGVLVALLALRGYVRLRSRALAQRAARLQAQVELQTIELRQTVDELRRTQGELQSANVRLEELTQIDELTGVANRRRLRTVLEAEWGRAARHGRPISFVMLDLDQFKLLNDSRGHHEGDRCLQKVARYLDGAVRRRSDLLVRYGGEEFAVLLPDTDLAGALEVAEKLREGIEELAIPHEAVPHGRITASFGVAALVPLLGQKPEILIEAADRALYRAKAEGRNRVHAEDEPPELSAAAN